MNILRLSWKAVVPRAWRKPSTRRSCEHEALIRWSGLPRYDSLFPSAERHLRQKKSPVWRQPSLKWRTKSTLTTRPFPRRGEIWSANLGTPPVRHWVLIVSLDARNSSDRIDSVLIVPLAAVESKGQPPFGWNLEKRVSRNRHISKGTSSQLYPKHVSLAREARTLSDSRMREVVA